MQSVFGILSVCVYSSLASSYAQQTYTAKEPGQRNYIAESPETSITKYPSAALLLAFNELANIYYSGCGGTIVNKRSVLTDASCVDEYVPVETWRFRIGSSYITQGGVVYTAGKVIFHPDFNSCTGQNGLALIQSRSFFDYNENVNRAPIAGKNYIVPVGEPVWAVGWGGHDRRGAPWNDTEILREMRVPTISVDACNKFYNKNHRLNVTENMICTGLLGATGHRSCINNNGSPVYHNGVLVGVRGWFDLEDCDDNVPEVSMKISHYIDWLQNNI